MSRTHFLGFAASISSFTLALTAGAEPPPAATPAPPPLSLAPDTAATTTPTTVQSSDGYFIGAPVPPGPPRVMTPWPVVLLPAPELERRSTVAMVSGIVLSSAGALSLLYVGATAMSGSERIDENGQSVPSNDDDHDRVARGAVIGGLVCLAVGIPLIVYGAKQVPLQSSTARVEPLFGWAGSPTARGWAWHF